MEGVLYMRCRVCGRASGGERFCTECPLEMRQRVEVAEGLQAAARAEAEAQRRRHFWAGVACIAASVVLIVLLLGN